MKPFYGKCDGLLIPPAFSPDMVRSAMSYKPKAEDLFVVTFPKCGTTWMQHIVMLIFRRGEPFGNTMDFIQYSPFLELLGAEEVERMKRPGIIKMHLPLPLAHFSSEARYIYVARNPKDCCVSFYHQTKNIPYYRFTDGSFEDFFEAFIKGEVENNDYFDHLLPWYQHRNDPNVYFVTYEKLKKDTEREVVKLAKFLGDEYYTDIQKDPQYLKDVLYYSSFEYMRNKMNADIDNLLMNRKFLTEEERSLPAGLKHFYEYISKDEATAEGQVNFIRKGIVGDWKNHFTPELEKKMEEYIVEKTAGSDVMSLWYDR